MLYVFLSIVLYIILYLKGNSKVLFDLQWTPFQWWLYTGLISNYIGLTSWWYFVEKYNIWGALAITYCLHSVVKLGLSFYFFELPTTSQLLGLSLILIGGFLILK
jgi:hypothetical protein